MFQQFKRIFGHSIVYGLGVIMSQAVGFLMIPVYTRYLTTQDYGALELLMRTGNVVGMLLVMGLGTAVMRLYADCKNDEERAGVVATATLLTLGVGVVAICGLLTCAGWLSALVFSEGDYSFLFRLLLICNFFEMSLVVPFTLLRAKDRSRFYVTISLGRLVLALSLNIWFVVFMGKTVEGILCSSLITGGLCSLVLVTSTLRHTGLAFSVTKAKALLVYGLPLVPSSLLILVLHYADRFLLETFWSTQVVGLYALGHRFGMTLGVLINEPFTLALSTHVYNVAKQADPQKVYARMLTYYVYIAVFYALGLAVFAKDLIMLVAAPAFHQAHVVVPAVLLAYASYGAYNLLQIGVHLTKRTQYVPLCTGVGAVTNIGGNLLLIPPYGMMGAACAGFLAFLVMALFTGVISHRFYPIRYEFPRLIRILGVAATLYLVGSRFPMPPGWAQWLWKAIAVLSFPAALHLVGFYTKEEVQRAAQFVGRIWPRLTPRAEPSKAV